MSLELFHHCPYFHSQLIYLDSLSQGQGFPSFVPVVDGSYTQEHTHSPTITKLALVCTEIALAKYWESLGVRPDVIVGHSLGEYAALHIAGVMSASDTIFLVGHRATVLEQRCQHGSHKMLAVRASLAEIQSIAASKSYEIACINGPKDTVLSGTLQEIDALVEVLQGAKYKCFSLDVAFAFHSAQTDPILDEFEEIANTGILFQPPNMPIISPLLGKVIFDEKTVNARYMRRATREAVNFLSAIETAQKTGTIDETMVWVEIGPHPVCMSFIKSILPCVIAAVPSLRRAEDNWKTMSDSLGILHCAGVEVGWSEFHRPFGGSLRLLDLPTYAWNDKNYWIQYNGDWALTKGNTFYDLEKHSKPTQGIPQITSHSGLRTSTVQHIIEETFSGSAGSVVIQSDLMQPDFLAAAHGHKMNGCGVVTSSIHADIAFTLGEYLLNKLKPNSKDIDINITNLEVSKGLVAQKNTEKPQLIQVSATVENIEFGIGHLKWYNVSSNGEANEPFATAIVQYGCAADWLAGWIPMAHLIQSRIEALERLAEKGNANRFSHKMVYLLFANSLVDYANKYRGMQSVVMHEFEAFADIKLTEEKGGTWTIPPYFIDSVAHLAGFIMNVSDASDTKSNFCVTPGWGSMRFAQPLVASARYRSYVKMIPTAEDPNIFQGDVYVLQDSVIIGMVGAIKFRRYPRLLLSRFFSAPDEIASAHVPAKPIALAPAPIRSSKPTSMLSAKPELNTVIQREPAGPRPNDMAPSTADKMGDTRPSVNTDSTTAKAIALVATEAGLDAADLGDDASFVNLGIDSLMSLVIAEKFREQLGVVVNGSLFLEYPTIGDLKTWLMEYYS